MPALQFAPSFTSSTTTQTPWAPQAGALTDVFKRGQGVMQQQMNQGPYQGDYIAQGNGIQNNAINSDVNFATGAGANVGANQIDQGNTLMGQGFSGANGAMSGLQNFNGQNFTQGALDSANTFANNPNIPAAADAANYNTRRYAAENALPSIYRGAAGSGNINSSQTALGEGVVNRGVMENRQNIEAGMRNDAWNTGLQQFNNNNAMQLSGLNAQGNLGSTLGAAGSGMMSQGINDYGNVSNIFNNAGNNRYNLDQAGLSNNVAKYQGQRSDQWSPLQNYYGIVGANNWGGTTNSSTASINPYQPQQNPGALSYLGAGLGMAGAVAGTSLGPAGTTLGGMAGRAIGGGIANMAGYKGPFSNGFGNS